MKVGHLKATELNQRLAEVDIIFCIDFDLRHKSRANELLLFCK